LPCIYSPGTLKLSERLLSSLYHGRFEIWFARISDDELQNGLVIQHLQRDFVRRDNDSILFPKPRSGFDGVCRLILMEKVGISLSNGVLGGTG
jgi:hypothetical protein